MGKGGRIFDKEGDAYGNGSTLHNGTNRGRPKKAPQSAGERGREDTRGSRGISGQRHQKGHAAGLYVAGHPGLTGGCRGIGSACQAGRAVWENSETGNCGGWWRGANRHRPPRWRWRRGAVWTGYEAEEKRRGQGVCPGRAVFWKGSGRAVHISPVFLGFPPVCLAGKVAAQERRCRKLAMRWYAAPVLSAWGNVRLCTPATMRFCSRG